ncbi:MAG: hypothetical protein WDZ28_01645 [Simkaniaceae bacterium]
MKPFFFPFILALISITYFPLLLPKLHLFYFAPFLSLLSKKASIKEGVFLSILSGWILDALSTNTIFGFEAFLFLSVYLMNYPLKDLFFIDKPHASILSTALISINYTFLKILFLLIFSKLPPLTLKSLLSEFFLMPLADGIYGFFWFTTPLLFVTLLKKSYIRWKTS